MRKYRDLALAGGVVAAITLAQWTGGARVWAQQQENGIAVGDPKIFDNRALALMLDALNDSLRATTVIDAAKIAAASGNFQGFQQDAIARSFSLQGAPLPGIVEGSKVVGGTENAGGGTVTKTSQPSGNSTSEVTTTDAPKTTGSTENTTQTTTAARTPVNPTLPGFLQAPAFTPQFGMNSSDVLTDQVNLTHQIVNLRMLLDRALTDRLLGSQPRLQAVLGFNVSLDPPRDSQDSAAFVEITMSTATPSGNTSAVSIVALMPQEKTYNAAQLSNRANAFGGSAVASVFSMGYNEQRQSQTFYLYRDNDTIAYERMNDQDGTTTFGWSFRPVLGRRSVSPGTRQMFAVISLPAVDGTIPAEIPMAVQIKTYWRHFDRKLKTSSESRTFWQNLARVVSFGSAQDRPRGGIVSVPRPVLVPTTLQYQDNLTPDVQEIDWDLLGPETAMVRVRGKNFFQGTEVRLGNGRFATPADGLTLKSDKAFDLSVPISTLMSNGFVVGRYGTAAALTKYRAGAGLSISGASIDPPLGGRSRVQLRLRNGNRDLLSRDELPMPALIKLNDVVIAPPYDFFTDEGDGQLYVAFYVPDAIPTTGMVSLRFPFATDRWAASFRVYDPSLAFSVTRFASEDTAGVETTKLLITTNDYIGNPFDCSSPGPWRLGLGVEYPVTATPPVPPTPAAHLRSPRQIEFRAPSGALDKHPLLLIDCLGTVHPVTTPPAAAKAASTTLGSVDPPTVSVNDARKVTIKGVALDRIVLVTANGMRLDSRPVGGGSGLEVFLTRSLTEKPGVITLLCRDDRNAIVGSIDLTIH